MNSEFKTHVVESAPEDEQVYRILCSISVQRAGVPYASAAAHTCSIDTASVSAEQANYIVDTVLRVLAMAGVIVYSTQDEAEIKAIFETAVKNGMVDKNGKTVMVPTPAPTEEEKESVKAMFDMPAGGTKH